MSRSRSRARQRGVATPHNSAVVAASAFGLSSWDASTALGTAISSGVNGSAVNGVSVGVIWSASAVPSVLQNIVFKFTTNNSWLIRVSAAAIMQLQCGNGAATATAPTRTIVAGDLNKLHITWLACDITAVYHYHDAAQVGTSTALAGYTANAARTMIGSTSTGSSPASDFTVYDVVGRNSHLTLADYQTICSATKAANTGRFALGGITMEHRWQAPTSATVPATVSDTIGSDNMSFIVGSEANLVSAAMSPIVWGF